MLGRTFTCVTCKAQKPIEEGTVTAYGLTCRGCAQPPTPLAKDEWMDSAGRVLFSPTVLIPVLLVVIVLEFTVIVFGWDGVRRLFGGGE